jgi:hypothetical protein
MMVEKANHIYLCWAIGKEELSLVLRHSTDDANDPNDSERPTHSAKEYAKLFMSKRPAPDSFTTAHPMLTQCIAEVHERALYLLPLREPCQCSARACADSSQMWSSVPEFKQVQSSVLPDMYTASFAPGVLCSNTPDISPSTTPPDIMPASRMAVVDTLNFDFGALNPSWNDQSWMAWF